MSDPILRDLPTFLDTGRLHLRMARPGDGPLMAAAVTQSQPHLKPWMPWAVSLDSDTEYEALMRRWQLNFLSRKEFQFLIFRKTPERLIGATGGFAIHWEVPSLEIGYWLHPEWVGRGLMTEAVLGLVDYFVREIQVRRLEIRCDSRNEKSAGVARRAGFNLEGKLWNHRKYHLDDSLEHTLIFGRVFD